MLVGSRVCVYCVCIRSRGFCGVARINLTCLTTAGGRSQCPICKSNATKKKQLTRDTVVTDHKPVTCHRSHQSPPGRWGTPFLYFIHTRPWSRHTTESLWLTRYTTRAALGTLSKPQATEPQSPNPNANPATSPTPVHARTYPRTARVCARTVVETVVRGSSAPQSTEQRAPFATECGALAPSMRRRFASRGLPVELPRIRGRLSSCTFASRCAPSGATA